MAAPAAVNAESILARLRAAPELAPLSPASTCVETSGTCDGGKYEAVVVSPAFEGKPLLERHRLVNAVLAAELKGVHAFSFKALTPAQAEARGQQRT